MKKKTIGILATIALSAMAVGVLASCSDEIAKTFEDEDNVSLDTVSETGRTIYVSAEADANYQKSMTDADYAKSYVAYDGTDAAKPASLEYALLNALPGDHILIGGGVYNYSYRLNLGQRPVGQEDAEVVTGTYDNYITVEAASTATDADRVVLNFSAMSFSDSNRGIQLYSDFWHFKNIEVYGAGDNGMYIAGSHNIVEGCLFYGNKDTGLQLGRAYSTDDTVDSWPTCNLIKNCTSFGNYDTDTFGENADGFAAKLTVGYGNIFDGCIAFRNSDDGWDLFAKVDSGDIGTIILYNCVSFENGFLPYQHLREDQDPTDPDAIKTYDTLNGDGIGFKLGGSTMRGNVIVENSLTFDNKLHGIGDNSNPGVLQVTNLTAFNNCAGINDDGTISDTRGLEGIQNKSNNIDLARSIDSYNSYYGILSYVNNQTNYSTANDSAYNKDAYRGSAAYCIFQTSYNNGEEYKAFTGWEDASSYRTATEDLAFSDGVDWTGTLNDSCFGDLTAINATCADNSQESMAEVIRNVASTYRNEDGSVNMGDKVALTDATLKTYADGNPVGAVLNKKSWDDYTHYGLIDFLNNDFGTISDDEVAVDSALSICEAITRYDATYQDFKVPKLLHSCDVYWSSSDESVLSVEHSEEYSVSYSAFSWIRVTVPETDTKVTLTATASKGKIKKSKTIEITVKGRKQTLGELVSSGESSIRVNLYGSFIAPRIYPTDDSSITTSELPASLYDLRYTVKYATDGNSKFYTIATDVENVSDEVYTSVPGVYEVTATATLKSNTAYTSSLSYKVYVVDPDCDIDFMGDSSISLSKDGFVVSGSLSNIEGSVVAMTSTEKLTVATAADIIAIGGDNVQYYPITTDSVVASFLADNTTITDGSTQYYLYYAVVNANRSNATKNKATESAINVVTIDSEEEFYSLARSGSVKGASLTVNTIYSLTKDLDFSETGWAVSASATEFKGLFRGNNHTISNIHVDASSNSNATKTVNVFYKVTNGTVMDVFFDNCSFKADTTTGKQLGIIGDLQGGYVSNVHATRISAYGKEAVGAIIGQVTGGINYVSECSLVNPIPEYTYTFNSESNTYAIDLDAFNAANTYSIHAANKYAGGIIGNAQMNSDQSVFDLTVTNCYVNAAIGDGKDAGGNNGLIVSRVKNDSTVYNVNINHNVAYGIVLSKGQYNAGIVGDFDNGSGNVSISFNLADVSFVYNGIYLNADVCRALGSTYAHKNSSPIVGRAVTNPAGSYSTRMNTGSWGEYYTTSINSTSIVYTLEADDPKFVITEEYASGTLQLDMKNIWIYDETTHTVCLRAIIVED